MTATHAGSVEWPVNWLHLRISLLAHDSGLHKTYMYHNDKVFNIVIGMSGALQQTVHMT